jgi:hypothetical protein
MAKVGDAILTLSRGLLTGPSRTGWNYFTVCVGILIPAQWAAREAYRLWPGVSNHSGSEKAVALWLVWILVLLGLGLVAASEARGRVLHLAWPPWWGVALFALSFGGMVALGLSGAGNLRSSLLAYLLPQIPLIAGRGPWGYPKDETNRR